MPPALGGTARPSDGTQLAEWPWTCDGKGMLRGRTLNPAGDLTVYQHDAATAFRFVLTGMLAGSDVEELEHAWMTAHSVMKGKELIVDITSVLEMDAAGTELLARMRASGARILSSPEPARARTVAAPAALWRRWLRPRSRGVAASVAS